MVDGLCPQVNEDCLDKRLFGSVMKLTVFKRFLPAVRASLSLELSSENELLRENEGSVPVRDGIDAFDPEEPSLRRRALVWSASAMVIIG